MPKLLIVVDMQRDFVDGALGTPEAQAILPRVVNKIRAYQAAGDSIVLTMDTHPAHYLETQEGRHLPVTHCVKDTEGWQLHPAIAEAVAGRDYKIYEKPAFGSAELAEDVKNGLYSEMTEIELVGLCTDICVVSNALLLKTMLPELPLHVDASCCAGVRPESHEAALTVLEMCQVKLLNKD